MGKLSQSLNSISSHMIKNRPIEFEEMGSRLKRLGEKLKTTEKVVNKMVKEQTGGLIGGGWMGGWFDGWRDG